jgi:peptidoglycan/LPS O-acetylase OafA/YrhL
MPQTPGKTPGFRSDINGLRAWAVVAVMLYHFAIPGFTGGFVGVDIFFVISGFLMTGIVAGGLLRGDFSIQEFYLARARRILPALIVLCATLLALGWWLLLPVDYQILGKQSLASLLFLSNIEFWHESGYFDAASHEKWLLHTWSLAVEWQFYLLLPLVLTGLWKLLPGRRSMSIVMAFGLLASLVLSVLISPGKPSSAFFLLPTRAWEMLAGGLVYLLAVRAVLSSRQRLALELAGLALMAASIGGFDSSSVWPGWRAMVPVLGTVLVLTASRSGSLWTGNPLAQWLGTRSYSLYLWHWPIVVGLAYAQRQADTGAIIIGLGLTLLLGDLSLRWVETPARRTLGKMRPRQGAVSMVCATLLIALPGSIVQSQAGIVGRFPREIELISLESLNKNPRADDCLLAAGSVSPSCISGGSQVAAILVGDSHANAVVSALALATPQPDGGVMEWSYRACPVLLGVRSVQPSKRQCGAFVDWAIAQLEGIPDNMPVIVVNRHGQYALGQNEDASQVNIPAFYFSRAYAKAEPAFLAEYAEQLTATACALARHHPVYLVRPIPEMGANVPNTARAMVWGEHHEVSISLAEYHQRNDIFWAAQDAARERCGVRILDPLPYLCHDGRCQGSLDGRPLYHDDDHLSEFGNRLLVPMFAQIAWGTTSGLVKVATRKAQ